MLLLSTSQQRSQSYAGAAAAARLAAGSWQSH
jgi:hypothetical protein